MPVCECMGCECVYVCVCVCVCVPVCVGMGGGCCTMSQVCVFQKGIGVTLEQEDACSILQGV